MAIIEKIPEFTVPVLFINKRGKWSFLFYLKWAVTLY